MKTDITVYKADAVQLPVELVNAREYLLSTAGTMMRMFGIDKVAVTIDYVGPKMLTAATFTAAPDEPPSGLARCRPFIVRQLAELLPLVGVLSIEVKPTSEERTQTQSMWHQMLTGDPAASKPIYMTLEEDPTRGPAA